MRMNGRTQDFTIEGGSNRRIQEFFKSEGGQPMNLRTSLSRGPIVKWREVPSPPPPPHEYNNAT